MTASKHKQRQEDKSLPELWTNSALTRRIMDVIGETTPTVIGSASMPPLRETTAGGEDIDFHKRRNVSFTDYHPVYGDNIRFRLDSVNGLFDIFWSDQGLLMSRPMTPADRRLSFEFAGRRIAAVDRFLGEQRLQVGRDARGSKERLKELELHRAQFQSIIDESSKVPVAALTARIDNDKKSRGVIRLGGA